MEYYKEISRLFYRANVVVIANEVNARSQEY